jgi:hypothetical protein
MILTDFRFEYVHVLVLDELKQVAASDSSEDVTCTCSRQRRLETGCRNITTRPLTLVVGEEEPGFCSSKAAGCTLAVQVPVLRYTLEGRGPDGG